MRGVIVWFQYSIVKFFDLTHLSDFVTLDGVLTSALDVYGNANAKCDNGDHKSN